MTDQQRKNWNEYQRQYKRRNPDKAHSYKLRYAINFLEKNGYKVTDLADNAKEKAGE